MKALRLFICLGISILAICGANLLVAQTYEGRILGTITDQSGAAIKDAKVVITNVDTGIFRELATNEAGEYVAPNWRREFIKLW